MLPEAQAVSLAADVVLALEHLHAVGICHLTLAPDPIPNPIPIPKPYTSDPIPNPARWVYATGTLTRRTYC